MAALLATVQSRERLNKAMGNVFMKFPLSQDHSLACCSVPASQQEAGPEPHHSDGSENCRGSPLFHSQKFSRTVSILFKKKTTEKQQQT